MTGNIYFDMGLILTIIFSVCWFSFWFVMSALEVKKYDIRDADADDVGIYVVVTITLHTLILLAYPVLIIGTALFFLLRTLYRYLNVRKDKIKGTLKDMLE